MDTATGKGHPTTDHKAISTKTAKYYMPKKKFLQKSRILYAEKIYYMKKLDILCRGFWVLRQLRSLRRHGPCSQAPLQPLFWSETVSRSAFRPRNQPKNGFKWVQFLVFSAGFQICISDLMVSSFSFILQTMTMDYKLCSEQRLWYRAGGT